MKVVPAILTVLFALFAIVQFNDPDPWAWIAMYGFVAVVAGFAAFGRFQPYVILAGLAVVVIWMVTLVPDFIHWVQMGMPTITGSMKATEPHIELTREFLGLLLCGAALGYIYFQSRKPVQIA